MTTHGVADPDWPAQPKAAWRKACDLLEAGQYEQVAEVLGEVQAACEQMGDAGLAQILAAACRICLACSQCRAETEWHQQACQESGQREQALSQQLQSLLDLVSGRETSDTPWGSEALSAPVDGPSLPGHAPAEPLERSSLRQRLQSWLGRSALTQSPEQEPPEISDVAPSPSFRDETEMLAAPPRVQSEPPTLSSEQEPPEISDVAPFASFPDETEMLAAPGRAQREAPPLSLEQEPPEVSDVAPSPSSPDETEMPVAPPRVQSEDTATSLVAYCLGPFRVFQNDQPIIEWSSSKAKSIFKYLLAHPETRIAKEVLMDIFWPEATPKAARRNLHQAIYSLRQTVRGEEPDFQHIRFEEDCYLLNPEMDVWLDFKEFGKHVQAGQRLEAAGQLEEAIAEYGVAEGLYQGDFLEEDLYEDWPQVQREHIRNTYLDIVNRLGEYYVGRNEYPAAIALCQKVLARDNCYEEAYYRLMQCFSAQGQRHLAVRQYQNCVEVLKQELDLPPSEETVALYRRITTTT